MLARQEDIQQRLGVFQPADGGLFGLRIELGFFLRIVMNKNNGRFFGVSVQCGAEPVELFLAEDAGDFVGDFPVAASEPFRKVRLEGLNVMGITSCAERSTPFIRAGNICPRRCALSSISSSSRQLNTNNRRPTRRPLVPRRRFFNGSPRRNPGSTSSRLIARTNIPDCAEAKAIAR